MAVGAALRRRDPRGDGDHQARELGDAEIPQHLDVLVDARGRRPAARGGRERLGRLVRFQLGGQQARVLDLLDAETPEALLGGVHRWPLARERNSGETQGEE